MLQLGVGSSFPVKGLALVKSEEANMLREDAQILLEESG